MGEGKVSEAVAGVGLLHQSNFRLGDLFSLPSRETFNGMFLAFNMNFLMTMLLRDNGTPIGAAITLSASLVTTISLMLGKVMEELEKREDGFEAEPVQHGLRGM